MLGYLQARFPMRGRIGRGRYWALTLLYLVGWLVGAAILIALAVVNYNPPDDVVTTRTIVGFVLLGIAMVVFVFVTVAGFASAGVRRLHDRGKSGYWLLLYYLLPSLMVRHAGSDSVGIVFWLAIVVILAAAVVELGILRGEPGSNAFGPDPLAAAAAPQPAN